MSRGSGVLSQRSDQRGPAGVQPTTEGFSMRELFLVLAAAISAFGLYVHMVRGRRLIVAPMLQADLHAVPKYTLEFAWTWGTATMCLLTLSFLAPILRIDFMPLAMLATVYAYCLGALSFLAMRRRKFRVGQMPQWIVFWAAAACGLVAWGIV